MKQPEWKQPSHALISLTDILITLTLSVVLLLTFRKIFDTVNHEILLVKLVKVSKDWLIVG